MNVPAPAIGLCTHWEGLHKIVTQRPVVTVVPYLCPALVATIGYGTTRYETGAKVQLEDPAIDEQRAKLLLLYQLERDWLACLRICPRLLTEPERRGGAVLSFVYNLGAGRLQASTFRLRINQGAWSEAAYECRRWVYAGGKKLAGLIARRDEEARMLV